MAVFRVFDIEVIKGERFGRYRPVTPDDITDEVIERAARAANLDAGRQRGLAIQDDWEHITEQERGGWRQVARAALAAALSEGENG